MFSSTGPCSPFVLFTLILAFFLMVILATERQAPRFMHKFIIGRNGQVKQQLERDNRVQIFLPNREECLSYNKQTPLPGQARIQAALCIF